MIYCDSTCAVFKSNTRIAGTEQCSIRQLIWSDCGQVNDLSLQIITFYGLNQYSA